jgi:hypothetical protein
MKASLQVELESTEESLEKQVLLIMIAGRIQDLTLPLDLSKLRMLVMDTGLSDADARAIMSEIVTLPKDWPISKVREFLLESITKRLDLK